MTSKNFIYFFLLLSLPVSAQVSFDKLINNDLLRYANISFLAKEIATDKVLCEYQPHHAFAPASTMKLVTTATAIEVLGSNFRFETRLEYDGNIDYKGTLNGNIYIRGGYDPTLGSEKIGNRYFLNNWVKTIKDFGIKKINGKVIGLLPKKKVQGTNTKWIWEDIGNYYAPIVQPIAYNDNNYKIILQSGNAGTKTKLIGIYPKIKNIELENYVFAANIGYDNAYIYGSPLSKKRIISGEIPSNRQKFIIKGSMPNPTLELVRDMISKLRSNGIMVKNSGIQEKTDSKTTKIYSHWSPRLGEIIKEINFHSNNHFAEYLYQYLIRNKKNFINLYWTQKGLPTNELFQYDGSGLSPVNSISANFLVSLLAYISNSDNYNSFKNSLPIVGKNGTVKSFLTHSPLSGKVRAKSGSFSRVRSYAGYCFLNHKEYYFAIIVNNANGSNRAVKKEIENILINVFR